MKKQFTITIVVKLESEDPRMSARALAALISENCSDWIDELSVDCPVDDNESHAQGKLSDAR